MKLLSVIQGSPEWLAIRSGHFCASDAPAMMGASTKMTRTELVRLAASGDRREFSDWVQSNLLDKGHEVEAKARTFVEQAIGEELFPATATDDDDYLLASFDGITMDGETGFECKLWNEDLAAAVRNKELPPAYYWQLEQQILIAGLRRVIFVCTDGADKLVRMQYFPVEGRAQQLLAGWKQFAEDVKNYVHVETLPSPTGKAIMALPALVVQLVGEVKESNLVVFKQSAIAFIKAINTNLQTDQDFADAEKTVKYCGEAETNLENVKRAALAQTASIDELFRTIDVLSEEMRSKRLELGKLVEARKKAIREEIRQEGITAAATHLAALNRRLGKSYMPTLEVDFAGVMKGKKTITSLRDAVNTELARYKIATNEVADKIETNLKELATWGEYPFLFHDAPALVLKACDDFATLCKGRVDEHKAKVAKQEEEQRERIRQEELKRIEDEKVAAAKKEADRIAAQAKAPIPTHQTPEALGRMFEPPKPDIVEPTQTAPQSTVPGAPMVVHRHKPQRPQDDHLIHLIAITYEVDVGEVIRWLREMDLDAVSQRMLRVA